MTETISPESTLGMERMLAGQNDIWLFAMTDRDILRFKTICDTVDHAWNHIDDEVL